MKVKEFAEKYTNIPKQYIPEAGDPEYETKLKNLSILVAEKLRQWFKCLNESNSNDTLKSEFIVHGLVTNPSIPQKDSSTTNKMFVALYNDKNTQIVGDSDAPVTLDVGNPVTSDVENIEFSYNKYDFISSSLFLKYDSTKNTADADVYLSRYNMVKISPFISPFPNPSLAEIKQRIEKKYPDYQCDEKVLAQFRCALDSNQIIILHGAPGTGKTSLVKNVAEAMDAICRIIPVRPNWTDSQDLMGFFNPVEHRYYSTPFLEALCAARQNPGKRYFICLDEMNLAHAEYYLSDILSAMESQKPIPLYPEAECQHAIERLKIRQAALAKIQSSCDADLNAKYAVEQADIEFDLKNLTEKYTAEFTIPDNVQFIGTLNMDATTCDLSPKIIDRSFIIKVTGDKKDNSGMNEKEKLREAEASKIEDFNILTPVSSAASVNALCDAVGKKVSKRVEHQLKTMIKQAVEYGLLPQLNELDYMDYMIACKILPMLNTDHVEISDENNILKIGDFTVIGSNSRWENTFPLSVNLLKSMCNVEEQTLNYWRMR